MIIVGRRLPKVGRLCVLYLRSCKVNGNIVLVIEEYSG